jgi:hypothetical protein
VDGHHQIHAQVQQAQVQGTPSPLPPVTGQQIVHLPYPQQEQQQQQQQQQLLHHQQQQQQDPLNELMNHPGHEPAAQDPLDVHHEMHATRPDQTDM